jgi:hypothetical protein
MTDRTDLEDRELKNDSKWNIQMERHYDSLTYICYHCPYKHTFILNHSNEGSIFEMRGD